MCSLGTPGLIDALPVSLLPYPISADPTVLPRLRGQIVTSLIRSSRVPLYKKHLWTRFEDKARHLFAGIGRRFRRKTTPQTLQCVVNRRGRARKIVTNGRA